MKFVLYFSLSAKKALKELKRHPGKQKRYKSVAKALKLLSENPKHPSLQTHKYYSLQGPHNEEIFEACAQQHTPAAYRIFFFYGPSKGAMTIFAITPHP
jgi:hypothetical protein